jgi:hypothetical protein
MGRCCGVIDTGTELPHTTFAYPFLEESADARIAYLTTFLVLSRWAVAWALSYLWNGPCLRAGIRALAFLPTI